LAKEGRIAQADLGRLEQQELSSESTWISAVVNYKRALDNFKIQIGLKTDAPVMLDDRELERLTIHHRSIVLGKDAFDLVVALSAHENAILQPRRGCRGRQAGPRVPDARDFAHDDDVAFFDDELSSAQNALDGFCWITGR